MARAVLVRRRCAVTDLHLDDTELHWIVFALAELRRRRANAGGPVPHPVLALLDRLTLRRQHRPLSPPRQDFKAAAGESRGCEFIGSRCAAAMLGWNVRQVQRHRNDLDGLLIAGRLMFPADAVRDYRAALDRKQNNSD